MTKYVAFVDRRLAKIYNIELNEISSLDELLDHAVRIGNMDLFYPFDESDLSDRDFYNKLSNDGNYERMDISGP